jgi:hypothetical protein
VEGNAQNTRNTFSVWTGSTAARFTAAGMLFAARQSRGPGPHTKNPPYINMYVLLLVNLKTHLRAQIILRLIIE